MEILVSICCMTYNHEKYIAQALDSFLMQETDFAWEIVIHDDASADGTADIIREYARRCPNIIKPLIQTENQQSRGIKVNTVFNMPRSRGKYIAFCDGDDYWTDPHKLQKQITYMEANPGCSLSYTRVQMQQEADQKSSGFIRPYNESRVVPLEDILSRKGISQISSLVYRKECMQEPPDFYMKGPMGDYFMFIFLALQGSAYYIDEPMSVYRINVPGSWMNRLFFGHKEKRIWLNRGVLKSIDEFNRYTGYKYADIMRSWQAECEEAIVMAAGDWQQLRDAKYVNFSKKQFLYTAAKMYTYKYFPGLYQKMRDVKRTVRREV